MGWREALLPGRPLTQMTYLLVLGGFALEILRLRLDVANLLRGGFFFFRVLVFLRVLLLALLLLFAGGLGLYLLDFLVFAFCLFLFIFLFNNYIFLEFGGGCVSRARLLS